MKAKRPLEADVQASIREYVSANKLGVLFRSNVGIGWTGAKKNIYEDKEKNIVIIKNPRRFNTGLPAGFSDLFGIAADGRPVFIEVKRDEKEKPTEDQENFLEQMRLRGAYAGVARSPEDAEKIFRGEVLL